MYLFVRLRGNLSRVPGIRQVATHSDGLGFYNEPQERKGNPRDRTAFFDFRVLHDVRDVERVVRALDKTISVGHLSGALNRLHRLSTRPDADFVRFLADRTLQRLPDFEARHFATVWSAMVRLGWQDVAFYDTLAQEAMRSNYLQAYNPTHLSHLVYGVGRLQKMWDQMRGIRLRPCGENDALALLHQRPFLNALLKETLLSQHPGRLNDTQLGSVIYGLGLAKFRAKDLPKPLLETVTSAIQWRGFAEGTLVSMLYGMTLMGMSKNQEVMQTAIHALIHRDRLFKLKEKDLTCLIYVLRLLQYDEAAPLMNIRDLLSNRMRLKHFSEQSLSMMTTNMRCLGIKGAGIFAPLLGEIASERVLPNIVSQGLAMALYNYAVSEYRNTTLLKKLTEEAMQPKHIERFTPHDISEIMFALSLVNYEDRETLEPLKQRLSDRALVDALDTAEMLNLVQGCARFGWMSSLPYTFQEMLDSSRIHRMTSSQIVAMVYNMSLGGLADQQYLTSVLEQLLQMERLKEFRANQLGAILASLGKMQYSEMSVLKQWVSEIVKPHRREEFSATGLTMALHGLAGCEFRDGSLLGSFLREVILPSRLDEFQPAQLSVIMFSLGKIGVEDGRVIDPIMEAIMKEPCLAALTAHGLTNTLYGLAQLRDFDEHIWTTLSAEVRKPERLEQLNALELSLLLYAYGMKQWQPPDMDVLLQMAAKESIIKDYSTVGLASSLYSLAQLELYDAPCIEKMAREFVQSHRLEDCTSHHLANVVFALGILNYRNKDIMQEICQEVMRRVPSFSRHGLYNLFFGFGRLQYRDDALINALWKETLKLERLAGYTEREWATIAYHLSQLEFKDEDAVIRLRTKILSTRGLPTQHTSHIHSKHELTPSDLQKMRDAYQRTIQTESSGEWRGMGTLNRLDEKNVVWTKSEHEKYRDMSYPNWRDRSLPATYPPRSQETYFRSNRSIGPELLPKVPHSALRLSFAWRCVM